MTRTQRLQLKDFIQQKRRVRRQQAHAARRAGCNFARDTALELGLRGVTHATMEAFEEDSGPVGFHFSPQRHGLTWEQCQMADWLLRRANARRPIRGAHQQAQFRHALRIAGIISAVKGGRVGNSHFGYSLHGHRGGNVMRDHALHHLRAIAPLGRQAAQAAREGRKALKAWERTGQGLPLPLHTQDQVPLPQSMDPWQQWPAGLQRYYTGQQGQMPRDFMAW